MAATQPGKKQGPGPAPLVIGGILAAILLGCLLLIGLLALFYFLAGPQPAASIADNAVVFEGELPQSAPVEFKTKEGDTFTAPRAYPGLVSLYTELGTPKEDVITAITEKKGTLISAMPDAGLWTIQVEPGSEGAFMTALFSQPWFLDATPLSDFLPAVVSVYDYYNNTPAPNDCYYHHGNLVQLKAGGLGAQTEAVEFGYFKNDVAVATSMIERMKQAKDAGTNVVFSMSIGSTESWVAGSQDRTGCTTAGCKLVRRAQKLFFQTFLQALEAQIRKDPSITDRALLVVAAGNAGVEMDTELSYLQRKYPLAYQQVKIVGATDSQGLVYKSFNHITGTSASTLVYAQGNDAVVPGTGSGILCSGTSYAAPEVAAVLDHLWSNNPTLPARQVIDAFERALWQEGTNIVPHDASGRTTQGFLDQATAMIEQEEPEPTVVTPIGGDEPPAPGPVPEPSSDLEFIVPSSLPSGKVGEEYTYYFCDPGATQGEACGAFEDYMLNPTGGHPPYSFTLEPTVGFPPMGLSLMINGELKGTPAAEGQSTFGVCATDLSQNRECGRTTLTIDPEPETGCTSPYDGTWSGTRTVKGVQHWIGPWNGDTYPTEDRPFTVSYTLEITVKCYGDFEESSNEWNHDVLSATVSEPFFGCQSGCDVSEGGSNLQIPNPGEEASYPNFALYFPNGATLSATPISISPDRKTITLEGGMAGYSSVGSIERKTCPDCLSSDVESDTFILTKVG